MNVTKELIFKQMIAVSNHRDKKPLTSLLNKPNERQTRIALLEQLASQGNTNHNLEAEFKPSENQLPLHRIVDMIFLSETMCTDAWAENGR